MKNHISINQLGYPRAGAKEAIFSGDADAFSLIDSVNNEAVFSGKASPALNIKAWGEKISVLDFSEVTLSGSFFLSVNQLGANFRSGVFDIASNPYVGLTEGMMQAFFANRCGFDTRRNDNTHPHDTCHMNFNPHISRDFSGGYHDFAEYSRNVYSHAIGIAILIYSIIVNEVGNANMLLQNRRTDNTDSILNEIKYGLSWLLKMQDSDGGVFSGIETEKQIDICYPEEDNAAYELIGKTVYSTVAFAGVTALASWLFRKSDEGFSEKLRDAAVRAFIAYAEYSETHLIDFAREAKIATSADCDFNGLRFWALCELYALTGSEEFLTGAKKSIPADVCSFSPENAAGFGILSIFLHPDGGDLELRRKTMFALRVKADNLTSNSAKSFITLEDYNCFSNIKLMSDAITLFAAGAILKYPDYRVFGVRNFNYILGANPLDKCFVTGFGHNPVRRPRHTLSTAFAESPPLAGMVVNGANNDRLHDNYLKWQLPRATPPAKSYGDAPSSLTTNAVTLPATALLYFLAAIV
ncbi:MAG: glycoside hydrolase family 9 protein [Ruminococcus sp.]|jgi:endoglucanase|nr:glycoside hydrolase family 9 protein [Ruminococcus sp.]